MDRADTNVQYALTKLYPGSRNNSFDFKLNVTKRSTILAGLHPVRERTFNSVEYHQINKCSTIDFVSTSTGKMLARSRLTQATVGGFEPQTF